MNKFADFPEQPRVMSNEEAIGYFNAMLKEIAEYDPDEIVAVARSGFSYAMWVAQILKKPLGVYWPEQQTFIVHTNPRKVVFVDDNILQGSTFLKTKDFMKLHAPETEWAWAVLFSDWHTPQEIRNQIIQGVRLPYFAEEPMWGSAKVSKDYGVRYRDENSI
jgi:adenine/guanine phosphoribosyltransferase-like PRPP-binding protein